MFAGSQKKKKKNLLPTIQIILKEEKTKTSLMQVFPLSYLKIIKIASVQISDPLSNSTVIVANTLQHLNFSALSTESKKIYNPFKSIC